MAHILAADKCSFRILIPLECAAKMRTYLKGRTQPAREIQGRKVRKAHRRMVPSDFFTALAEEVLKEVKPDAESRKWALAQRERNLKNRELTQAKNLAARKPRDQWEKPGLKPGKEYPNVIAALKRRNEAVRARKASEKATRPAQPAKKPAARRGRPPKSSRTS